MRERLVAIERLCQERRRHALRAEVGALVRDAPGNPLVFAHCLDWYWRAGMLREGLRMALPDEELAGPRMLETLGSERTLWIARFLLSLGAWPFSRYLVSLAMPVVPRRDLRQRTLAGLVWLNLEAPEKALSLLSSVAQPGSERRVLVLHGVNEACWRLRLSKEGLKWSKRALERSTSDTDRWLFETYRAQFIGLEAPLKGVALMNEADRRLGDPATRMPRLFAYSQMARGTLEALAGRKEAALRTFEGVLKFFRDKLPEYQPWRILEAYGEMEKVGLLSARRAGELKSYFMRAAVAPYEFKTPESRRADSLRFSLPSDEFWFGNRPRLGIPSELQLLAYLRLGGDFGLPTALLKCLLWPTEISLFFHLDDRLRKLHERLASVHHFTIRTHGGVSWLSKEDQARVSVGFGGSWAPSFFSTTHGTFSSSELRDFYQVSPSQARKWLGIWEREKRIRQFGIRRGTRYLKL